MSTMPGRGGKRGAIIKRTMGVKKRGRYTMPPNTPSREDSVDITPPKEAREDEVVVAGQEVKTAGGAEEGDHPPTHEHTRVVGCAGVTDIGCRTARMLYAFVVMLEGIWDMFVLIIRRKTDDPRNRYPRKGSVTDNQSVTRERELSEG